MSTTNFRTSLSETSKPTPHQWLYSPIVFAYTFIKINSSPSRMLTSFTCMNFELKMDQMQNSTTFIFTLTFLYKSSSSDFSFLWKYFQFFWDMEEHFLISFLRFIKKNKNLKKNWFTVLVHIGIKFGANVGTAKTHACNKLHYSISNLHAEEGCIFSYIVAPGIK